MTNIIYDKDTLYYVDIIIRVDNIEDFLWRKYITEKLIINEWKNIFDKNGKLIDFTIEKIREIPFTSYSDYNFMRLENTILNDLFIFEPNIKKEPEKEENEFKYEDHNIWTFDKISESIKHINYDFNDNIITPILEKVNETKSSNEQLKLMKYICLYYYICVICNESILERYFNVCLPYDISDKIKIENNLLVLSLNLNNNELKENLFKHLKIITGTFGNLCYITFSKK